VQAENIFMSQIRKSIFQLYEADYRVRQQIFKSISSRVQKSIISHSKLGLQLALCFDLGFGTESNEQKRDLCLLECNTTMVELINEKNEIQNTHMSTESPNLYTDTEYQNARMQDLSDQGFLSIINLTEHYQTCKRFDNIEQQYWQEIESTMKALGPTNRVTALLRVALADTLVEKGKQDEAEKIMMDHLHWAQEHATGMILSAVHRLGSMVSDKSPRLEEAEEMLRAATTRQEMLEGKDHPRTLNSYSQLAGILQARHKFEEAEALERQVLNGCLRFFGPAHPDTLTSQANLGGILEGQGKHSEAETFYRQAFEGRQSTCGLVHPDAMLSAVNLACLLMNQDKYTESEHLLREAAMVFEKGLGSQNPRTINSLHHLAEVLRKQDRLTESEPLYRRVYIWHDEVKGERHPTTLIAASNLANVIQRLGELETAKEMFEKILKLREEVLGDKDTETLLTVNNLAGVLETLRVYEESCQLYERYLSHLEEKQGMEHPDTLDCMDSISLVLQGQGKYEPAEQMRRRSLEISERILGQNSSKTFTRVYLLAQLLDTVGETEEANVLFKRACNGLEQTLGPEDPATVICKAEYEIFLACNGSAASDSEEGENFAEITDQWFQEAAASLEQTSGELHDVAKRLLKEINERLALQKRE
jgi:tetratricopeptide (TPR) repeat protein